MLPKHEHPDRQFAYQVQSQRAKEAGVSPRTQRNLDWLARKAPEHLKRVRAGEVSVHRACIQASTQWQNVPLISVEQIVYDGNVPGEPGTETVRKDYNP